MLTRSRLGHCALNKTLKMIGKHQTGLCEECQEEESVEQVVLKCRRYGRQCEMIRNKMRELGVQEFTLRIIEQESTGQDTVSFLKGYKVFLMGYDGFNSIQFNSVLFISCQIITKVIS